MTRLPGASGPQESSELPGLAAPGGPVELTRDDWGIPTLTAGCGLDAWWALGHAAATDRLWQLEYDRRRATGRWAQVVGPAGVAVDEQGLRLDLVRAAHTDVAAMDAATRATFEAYAAGVDAGAAAGPLPVEFAVAGIGFEPWQAWHSVAAFKIRHVLMGEWVAKITRLMILVRRGADAFVALDPPVRAGMPLTHPAGSSASGPGDPVLLDRAELERLREQLAFLVESEPPQVPDGDGGSNVWALSGSRTATGKPLLANDSHRAVDVPNAYWQVRLRCPEFSVSGATFPGIPGFPHFGHTDRVGWAITHGTADAQDLVLEELRRDGDVVESRTADGWEPVEVRRELIMVAGAEPVELECLRTEAGPVVHGDSTSGHALSLRWTALRRPCRQFGVPPAMLTAASVAELIATQRDWVDPVNNLVCADVDGQIGYLLRGELPTRDLRALQIPLPAWEPGWSGRVPFDQMPTEVDPPGGIIGNGNNTVVDPGRTPVVGRGFTEAYRARRIHDLLSASTDHTLDDMQRMQTDRVSLGAVAWAQVLRRRGPYTGPAESARAVLVDWSGDLAEPGPAALLYACFRRRLCRRMLPDLPSSAEAPAIDTLLRRLLGSLVWPEPDGRSAADGLDDELVAAALADGWAYAVELGGADPRAWDWAAVHPLAPRHLLAPELRSPEPVGVCGDAETIAAAGYLLSGDATFPASFPATFPATLSSVYRQLLDFDDLTRSRWVVPGGALADPRSEHYDDQLALWATGGLIPMHPTD